MLGLGGRFELHPSSVKLGTQVSHDLDMSRSDEPFSAKVDPRTASQRILAVTEVGLVFTFGP